MLAGAAASAATAKLAGWELRQLASSPLSAEARRLKAEYRELAAANGAGATTPARQQGHAGDGRDRHRPARTLVRSGQGPCRAGCRELGALGTPAYRGLTQIIPFDAPAGDVRQPAPGIAQAATGTRVSSRRSQASGPGRRLRMRCPVRGRAGLPRTFRASGLTSMPRPFPAAGTAAAEVMIVMPGPDLRAGRQVVSARRPAGLRRNARDHETPAHGQAKPHSATSASRSASRRRESMGRHWVNVHMLLTWINRESWMFWIRLQMAPGTRQEVLLHR